MAVSRDGVHYSRPQSLLPSPLGWRTRNKDGSGPIEWRAEDHPAFGAVLRDDEVWIYIHHGVRGLSMRAYDGAAGAAASAGPAARPPHLARYRMPARALAALTASGLAELSRAESLPLAERYFSGLQLR